MKLAEMKEEKESSSFLTCKEQAAQLCGGAPQTLEKFILGIRSLGDVAPCPWGSSLEGERKQADSYCCFATSDVNFPDWTFCFSLPLSPPPLHCRLPPSDLFNADGTFCLIAIYYWLRDRNFARDGAGKEMYLTLLIFSHPFSPLLPSLSLCQFFFSWNLSSQKGPLDQNRQEQFGRGRWNFFLLKMPISDYFLYFVSIHWGWKCKMGTFATFSHLFYEWHRGDGELQ